MKRITILLSVFALVAGLSQCRKPSFSALNGGETQHVVLSANNGNDGSKVDVDFVQEAMNLTWEKGDEIKVSGGLNGKLTLVSGDGGPEATFEGYATRGTGNVVFTYGEPPVFMGQTGTQDCVKGNIRLEGTSEYKDNGNYNVLMKVPYAVLKLDLSAFADDTKKDGVTVIIKAGGETVASVEGVKNNDEASKALYVALPADGSEKNYTFSGNGMIASCNGWPLKANTFYTEKGEGVPTGNAIKIVAVPGFSVGESTIVEFAKGNLYWDGTYSKWKFEANQWSSASTWDANHVSHFFWSNTTDWQTSGNEPYAENYSFGTRTEDDVFFTNSSSFQVSGETAGTWRTLSSAEWAWLLNTGGSSGRTDANRFAKALVNGVKGLLIFPDGYTLPSGYTTSDGGTGMAKVNKTSSTDAPWPTSSIPEATWTEMESAGAVFLPASGYRYGTEMRDVDFYGNYWSGPPFGSEDAYDMYFGLYHVDTQHVNRYNGNAVRLVR